MNARLGRAELCDIKGTSAGSQELASPVRQAFYIRHYSHRRENQDRPPRTDSRGEWLRRNYAGLFVGTCVFFFS